MPRSNKMISTHEAMLLIQEVRKTGTCIWNPADSNFSRKFHVALAWKKIAKKLGKNEYILKVKWKNLKDTFRKELKKHKCDTISEYKGTWLYFEHIFFLKQSNMTFKDIDESNFFEESSPSEDNDDNDDSNENNDSINENNDNINVNNDTNMDTYITNIKHELQEYVELPEDPIGIKRRRINDNNMSLVENNSEVVSKEYEYDEMFLKSLTPYFSKLNPMRKLILRGRFQDILRSELAEQSSSK